MSVTWDEALDDIAAKLKKLRDEGNSHTVAFLNGRNQGRAGSVWTTFTNSYVFWGIQIIFGTVVPIIILSSKKTMIKVQIASLLAVICVFAERFSLVIPGQSVPPAQVVGRTMMGLYGEPAIYSISGAEVAIILGVVGAIGIAYILGLRFIKLIPSQP